MKLPSNHLRQNPLTRQWVIYAPQRSQRPGHSQKRPSVSSGQLPPNDAQCPFCPGNESMLPGLIYEIKSDNDGWLTRVVPNKYPALTPDVDKTSVEDGLYRTIAAFGIHDVVLETPFHNRDLPMLPAAHIESILETYLQRYRSIRDQFREIMTILIFRNHGPASGTSLVHPHSQIIATPVIPKYIREKEAVAESYYEQRERCLLCDVLDHEVCDASRCIYENNAFVGLVPYAAEVPYEIWLIPKRHGADFAAVGERQKADLAAALKNILTVLYERLDDPDYNYIIHSCCRPGSAAAALHWYVQIRPRMVTPAGFEIGSGVLINPSLPEENAEILRV
jgi:UDPglucose--hexose-1-phosphate uridylyltransferase